MRFYFMVFTLQYSLVGGLEHEFYFSIQLGRIIPTDELIFFRGVGIPPTRIPCTIPCELHFGFYKFENTMSFHLYVLFYIPLEYAKFRFFESFLSGAT